MKKDYKPETFEEFEGLDKIFEKFFKNNDSNERKKKILTILIIYR